LKQIFWRLPQHGRQAVLIFLNEDFSGILSLLSRKTAHPFDSVLAPSDPIAVNVHSVTPRAFGDEVASIKPLGLRILPKERFDALSNFGLPSKAPAPNFWTGACLHYTVFRHCCQDPIDVMAVPCLGVSIEKFVSYFCL